MTANLLARFSEDRFRSLDYDDIASVDKTQTLAVLGIIDEFFEPHFSALGYRRISRSKDPTFRKELWAWGETKLSKILCDKDKLDFLLDTTASCMEYFYPTSSFQFRMCQGTATCVMVAADDLVQKSGELDQFHHFSQRYLRGLPQPGGLCEVMAETFRDCDEFFRAPFQDLLCEQLVDWHRFLLRGDKVCGAAV